MQAAYIEQTGAPDVIQIGQLPLPYVASHDVLVKIKGVAVNHVDRFVRSGGFQTKLTYPFIIGRDAVGTVIQCGPAVSNFQVGDLVWTNSMGYAGRQGVTSEYAAIPEPRLFKIPAGCHPLKVVAAVHSAATAAILLTDVLNTSSGDQLLVEGGAGHVGRKLVQLAALMGVQVTATADPADFASLEVLGATTLYDYHQPYVPADGQVDQIVDTSGKVPLQANLACLKQQGRLALITAPATDQATFKVSDFYTNDKKILGFVISHATLPQLQQAAKIVNYAFSQGLLLEDKLAINAFPYAATAHRRLAAGGVKEKIVLVPDAAEIDF